MPRIIIDVRSPREYGPRHLADAINIEFHSPNFVTQMMEFPKDTELITYCNAGNRAGQAKWRLKSLGFTDVTSYGMMAASVATGTPVVYEKR